MNTRRVLNIQLKESYTKKTNNNTRRTNHKSFYDIKGEITVKENAITAITENDAVIIIPLSSINYAKLATVEITNDSLSTEDEQHVGKEHNN